MSNRLYFTYLKVQPLNDDGTPRTDGDFRSGESCGFSVWDDCDEHTDWGYRTFEEVKRKVNLGNIVEFMESLPEPLDGLADSAKERGMDFCGNWYTWEELLELQKDKNQAGT